MQLTSFHSVSILILVLSVQVCVWIESSSVRGPEGDSTCENFRTISVLLERVAQKLHPDDHHTTGWRTWSISLKTTKQCACGDETDFLVFLFDSVKVRACRKLNTNYSHQIELLKYPSRDMRVSIGRTIVFVDTHAHIHIRNEMMTPAQTHFKLWSLAWAEGASRIV